VINTSGIEGAPSLSPDLKTLYFCSNQPGGIGGWDMYEVPIVPVLDFNGDGIVDSADMCIMVNHWGTDEPSFDIGPMPWGDGIVDVQDLVVLAEHLFEEVDDPTLVAHWKLDETEGNIALDSAGELDGTVYGGPVWQPEGGMVGGALEFDGIDDYVSTPRFVLTQALGSDWLSADTTDGSLMTELKFLGKASRPLQSQAVITDSHWHRIGLVSYGSNRILYVDDVEVSSDIYDKGYLAGDLQIGAGKNLDPSTFWSGLIDDVRIYNRAVTP